MADEKWKCVPFKTKIGLIRLSDEDQIKTVKSGLMLVRAKNVPLNEPTLKEKQCNLQRV